MQALRPVTTVSPLQIQTLSRKAVGTTPAALEETNDTKTGEESSSTAAADQPSRFQTLRQNFSDKVKDTYYRMMTMVPYSVGMFLNVFA